jgi:hypothetical protein
MQKSEYEYITVGLGNSLNSGNTPAVITEHVDQGWDVQQIFTGHIQDQEPQTFALLRRKR